jgi:hypothetical protein
MKSSAVFFFLLLIPCIASAQFSFGVKGGVNITQLGYELGQSAYERQTKPGFHVGLITKLKVVDKLFFSPELLFVYRGKFDFSINKTDYNYIDLPILMSYCPNDVFEFQAGANFATKLTPDLLFKSYFMSWSGGIIGNLTKKFFIGGRFHYDITDAAGSLNSLRIHGLSGFLSFGYRLKE